jgi:hypothetical protein
MKTKIRMLFFFLFMLVIQITNAKNIYVNDAVLTGDVYCTAVGSAGGTGTAASPFLTLAAALGIAVNGDVIYVDAGTWTATTVTINTEITIIGAGSGKTIFRGANTNSGGGNTFAVLAANNITIKAMFFKWYAPTAAGGRIFDINGRTGIVIENVSFQENRGSANSGSPIVKISNNSNVTVRGLLFSCSGIGANEGGGLLIDNSITTISYSVFKGNENNLNAGGSVTITGTSNVTIDNCTFDGSKAKWGGAIGQLAGALTVTNTCFTGNQLLGSSLASTEGGGAYIIYDGTASFTNCSFSNNCNGNTGCGANSSPNGGAIRMNGGTVTLNTCSFTSNIDTGSDGADVHLFGTSNLNLNNVTFNTIYSGGTINIANEGTGNVSVYKSGTPTTGTGTAVSAPEFTGLFTNCYEFGTTRTDVTGTTATGWSDNHITGTTVLNMTSSLVAPIRTDVYSTCSTVVFTGWTDNLITQGGTCAVAVNTAGCLNMLNAASSTISPAMNFTTSSASKYLTFRARTFGTTTAAKSTITVSISTDNGVTWTVLGTRTPTSSTLAQMIPFNLSAYTGTQVRIRFQTLGADIANTNGAAIDDIAITNASTAITPTIDFTSKSVKVNYTQALVGGTNTTYNVVQPFISTDNGATWTALTSSNTAGTKTLDLSAYNSATTKIKFETPYANGTTGASIDNIQFIDCAVSYSSPISAPIVTCVSTGTSTCLATVNCATETNAPIITKCVDNKTVACGTTLADYTSEVSAFDDCSFTVTQSPAAGTALSGTTTVTMTVRDPKLNTTTCTFTVTVDASTWNGIEWSNGTPTSSTAVTFTEDFSSSDNLSACSVLVTNDANVVINSEHTFTVQNAVTVATGSTFTFNNNANLVQVNNVSNSGNIIMKRDTNLLKRLDYTIWSAPVAGQNLLAFSPSTLTNRFYTYNTATDAHSAVNPSSTSFATGLGYQIRVPNDHPISTPTTWTGTFTGVPNNGPYNVTISSAGNRYNMVGNPYPSPIDLTTFSTVNTSNIEGTIWFWRKENSIVTQGVWTTWNAGTFVTIKSSSNPVSIGIDPTNFDDVARNGQGFLVKGKLGITTLSFTNAMRVTNTSNQFFRTNNSNLNRIWLNLTSASGHFSQQAIRYSEGGTNDIDRMDAENINSSDVLFTSLRSNVATETNKFTIQSRQYPFDENDVVPLSVKVSTAGTYSIAIHKKDGLFEDGTQAIYLKDNLTNTETNLNNGSYSFVSEAGVFDTRFELKYVASALSNNQNNFENNVVVYQQNEIIHVNSSIEPIQNVKIFDIRGRLVHTADNINATSTNVKLNIENQVVLMRITLINGAVITRKILN